MKTTKRLAYLSGLLVAVFALPLFLNPASENDRAVVLAAEGGATISDVMLVAHAGNTSLIGELKAAVKDSGPANDKEWKAVKARGAVLATLATDVLAKQKPPKGNASSWKKQVSAYAENARKLADAASKKDLGATSSAVSTLARSCSGCHKPHK